MFASCELKISGFSRRVKPPRNALRPRQRKMLLINCAACAAPLAHNAPRCVRCRTRYCNATCQHDHWRRGHKQICKKIHRGGNAEQYNANKKYKEDVAVAVEAWVRLSPVSPAPRRIKCARAWRFSRRPRERRSASLVARIQRPNN